MIISCQVQTRKIQFVARSKEYRDYTLFVIGDFEDFNYRPKTKLRECYAFTCVCQSFCSLGGWVGGGWGAGVGIPKRTFLSQGG